MMTWILLIIILLALIVLGTWAFGSIFGRGEMLPPLEETRDVIAANAQAVREGRIDDVSLEVVPRGYRQDQVDALIAQLAAGSPVIPQKAEAAHSDENPSTSDDKNSSPGMDKDWVE